MILHVDMDAFYASVEQRDRPELRGQPVIVGGSAEGRGVVCAASYEARAFGVHSAMAGATARRLCPNGIFIRPRMEAYATASRAIREIFSRYTPLVQPLSLDEAFLDVTGSVRLFGSPEQIGRQIQADIRDELDLPASVGVAPNKSLAKIASDLEKPCGFCVVPADRITEFLDPLPVSVLWGVGRVANQKLKLYGVETVRQLRNLPPATLEASFGQWGRKLMRLCRGEDDRAVETDRTAKSISHETTFREDVTDADILAAWTAWLAEQVARRLRDHNRRAQTVVVKLRDSSFRTKTKSRSLESSTSTTRTITNTAYELLGDAIKQHSAQSSRAFRLVGVAVKAIDSQAARQGQLFGDDRNQTEMRRDAASDEISRKFGKHAIRPGSALTLPKRSRDNPYEGT